MSKNTSPNHDPTISAQTALGQQEYLLSTDGALHVTQTDSPIGSGNIATGQVSVSNSPTQIVAARANRASVTIVNEGTTDIYIGGSSVTTSTGVLLVGIKGAAIRMDTTVEVYGITSSGSQTVSYEEEY